MPTRLLAFTWHLVISGMLASASTGLVFLIWYPSPFASASGVTNIYLLMLMVDLVLGPLITAIIFDIKKKARKELKRDVCIIGVIQISALVYGLFVVFQARPVYVVYNIGRFDVTFANSISLENLKQVTDSRFQNPPLWGPKVVAAKLPAAGKLRDELLFSSLSGHGDLPDFPQYYVSYDVMRADVIQHAEPLNQLYEFNKARKEDVDAIINMAKHRSTDAGFLALKSNNLALTVIIDKTNGAVLEYSDLCPWH